MPNIAMIDRWDIYWITRLDAVRNYTGALLVVAVCITLFTIMMGPMAFDEGMGFLKKPSKRFVATFVAVVLAVGLVRASLPSTKEMAAIIAIPAIANSDDAQRIGTEIVDLAKEWLKELHPKEGK